MFRLLTYNVRAFVGLDRRVEIPRVGRVIQTAHPDAVVLQEVVQDEHGWLASLARLLGMRHLFAPSRQRRDQQFGNAALSRGEMTVMRHGPLPGEAEARSALWVRLGVAGMTLDLLTTHFGLRPPERAEQARALCGPRWLGSSELGRNVALAGDFNAGSGELAFQRLAARLPDVRGSARARLATWPAPLPLLCLDHIFTSARVASVGRVLNRSARIASDHLPFYADLGLS